MLVTVVSLVLDEIIETLTYFASRFVCLYSTRVCFTIELRVVINMAENSYSSRAGTAEGRQL